MAVLENVVFEEHYRDVDYTDKSVTGMYFVHPLICLFVLCSVFSEGTSSSKVALTQNQFKHTWDFCDPTICVRSCKSFYLT